ncbi:perlwapin-like [Zonotrichia leucophrys gambelii]|uniref:perlwapin-like n=1 Tax=Zonotrichia leucophrys gambelii TaxID=257770 RepID=UPI0031404CBF
MPNIPSSSMSTGVFLLLGLLILRAEPSITPEKGGDSQKPGQCPRDFMRCLHLESPLCANDSSCPAGLKCCLWECRLRCIPPAEEKPGACPAAAPEGLIAPCSFPCLEDKDCLGAQKCCPLGCGSACLEPAQDRPKPSEGPTVQPGSFRQRCRGDSDCPGAQKCCNSSCSQQCPPGVPAGEAGRDSMGQDGTGRDRMAARVGTRLTDRE